VPKRREDAYALQKLARKRKDSRVHLARSAIASSYRFYCLNVIVLCAIRVGELERSALSADGLARGEQRSISTESLRISAFGTVMILPLKRTFTRLAS